MAALTWLFIGVDIVLLLTLYFVIRIHKNEMKEYRHVIGSLKHNNRSLTRANEHLMETNRKLHKFYRDLYSQE